MKGCIKAFNMVKGCTIDTGLYEKALSNASTKNIWNKGKLCNGHRTYMRL